MRDGWGRGWSGGAAAWGRATRAVAPLGHLAVWTGVYILAAVACFAQLAGLAGAITPAVLACAAGTGLGVYLLDRVKLRDRWMDPADRAAAPERYAFLSPRAGAVRALALGALVLAAVAAWAVHPLGPLMIAGAGAGVVLYGGRPRGARARVKDVLIVKNLAVGAGITAFAALLVGAAAWRGTGASPAAWVIEHFATLALASAHLAARVFADAILCDIEDARADRAFGTSTLPNTVGTRRAWAAAAAIRAASALALLAWPPAAGARGAGVAWGVVTLVSTGALVLWRPRRVRDVVDARFGVEALAVWAWLRV